MARLALLSGVLFAAVLAGCGGETKNPGDISGVVFDENGDVVRDARVYFDIPGTKQGDRETVTNSSGAYVLTSVSEGDRLIRASIQIGPTRYYGSNLARITRGERTKNINIAVYPEQYLAAIRGTVRDRNGFNVVGARVFARQSGSTVLSSSYAITNDLGEYEIDALVSGVSYDLVANARGYNADTDFVSLSSGEDRNVDFILGTAGDPLLPPPTNLTATAWTSPYEATRSVTQQKALLAMKQFFNPDFKNTTTVTRGSTAGDPIEVDLTWDLVNNSNLLGYGVYRSTDGGSTFSNADFLRDPLAEFYADSDDVLREGRIYSYSLTSLNANYPDTGSSESNYSTLADAETLGSISTVQIQSSPLRFSWTSAQGADNYAVFLFDEYPDLGVSSVWNNYNTPVSGTSYTYGGPSLAPGTYYLLVLGFNNEDTGRTISRVVPFTVN